MNKHPDTIKYPETFDEAQWHIECPYCGKIIGFDGIFNWGWTQGCFGETKITPMDFDGVVERHKHYLIFETKNEDVKISKGQNLCLSNLRKAESFTIIKIWGKENPVKMIIDFHDEKYKSIELYNINQMRDYISRWYKWADKNISI